MGWRWVIIAASLGALVIWAIRWRLPESPRWLAQRGRLDEAERVIRAIEAGVQADCGGAPLPPPAPPTPEDPREGRYSEAFAPTYIKPCTT